MDGSDWLNAQISKNMLGTHPKGRHLASIINNSVHLFVCSFAIRAKLTAQNVTKLSGIEVRASQLAQASERVGSPIPASQQG